MISISTTPALLLRIASLRMAALAACAALPLAACSSGEQAAEDDGTDVASAAAEYAKLEKPEPGQYSMDVEITKLDMPGAPPELAKQMQTAMADAYQQSYCLTPEDADKGFEEVYKQVTKDGQCKFDGFKVDGGNIDGSATCDIGGGTMDYQMKGKVWSTGSDITANMKMNAQGRSMDMSMHMKSERTGDCA